MDLYSGLKKRGWKNGEVDNVILDMKTQLRRFKSEFGVEFLERVRRRTRIKTGALRNGWGFTMKQTAIELWNIMGYSWYQEFGTKYIKPTGAIRITMEEADQIAAIAKQRAGIKE